MTKAAAQAREAFRAGWYVNAAVDDQPPEYLSACEEVDWAEYQRAILTDHQSAATPAVSDIREFMGHAPTHCTICGARWGDGCKPPCINAPATWGPGPTEEEAEALCAADERKAEGR